VDAVIRKLNFDRLARPYRWLEYATFGRALERCRFHFLAGLTSPQRALVLGDGDGRFLARLLHANPGLHADVVDISPAMLRTVETRLPMESRNRVSLHKADAREFTPPGTGYDLVVTHFFFDCFFEKELALLIERIAPQLKPGALWVVSEFAEAHGMIANRAGKLVVSGLYCAFGLLTGLQVRSLPDHGAILNTCGFQLVTERKWLRGLLVSQLWQR
jgi:ubiquinone/menaquinone biosynthesis C-methylase UbiE